MQRETLNKLANELGITRLILSSGNNGSHNSYLGGNAFEALVGAVYLDQGYGACMRFMQKRILSQLINIDKVAYKEVNFKSKLIEWSQKNRVDIEFRLLEQKKDQGGSPTFCYQVVIEGLEAGIGNGYSKKESQQLASKLTLEKLRRKPQFIDAVFNAKAKRTKMEEMPVENVPDTEPKDDFIITQAPAEKDAPAEKKVSQGTKARRQADADAAKEVTEEVTPSNEDEFDLSDITANPKTTREDIIAAAEEAAFADEN